MADAGQISQTPEATQEDAALPHAAAPAAPEKKADIAQPLDNTAEGRRDIPIVGRFDKYRSSYWSGIIAALGIRYFAKSFYQPYFDGKLAKSYNHQHGYSTVTGTMLMGVAGLYAKSNYDDIRQVFSEVVGWEFGKEPKDVGISDLWNSKNTVVQQTMNNFVKFNVKRASFNLAFFVPFIPGVRKWLEKSPLNHGEFGTNLGLGANAVQLFNDILARKITPFEELQLLIDEKINHADHYADKFVATDLLDIYERHLGYNKKQSFMRHRGTPQWEHVMELFDRMADLMNETYKNELPDEVARFGFSKFIHLLGSDRIDPNHLETSRAYVEIINRYGVKELERAAAEINAGRSLDSVMERYPLAKESMQPGFTGHAEPQEMEGREALRKNILKEKQPVASFAAREEVQNRDNSPSLAV